MTRTVYLFESVGGADPHNHADLDKTMKLVATQYGYSSPEDFANGNYKAYARCLFAALNQPPRALDHELQTTVDRTAFSWVNLLRQVYGVLDSRRKPN